MLHRYCMPGTSQRRLFWGLAAWDVTLSLLVLLPLEIGYPCRSLHLGCDDRQLFWWLSTCNIFVNYGVFAGVVFFRFAYTTLMPSLNMRTTSHWTIAASWDVFQECSRTIAGAHDTSLAIILTSAAVTVALKASEAFGATEQQIKGSLVRPGGGADEHLLAMCGHADQSLCTIVWNAWLPLRSSAAGMLLHVSCVFLMTPLAVWTSTAIQAARVTNDLRIMRLKHYPVILLFLGLSTFGMTVMGYISYNVAASREQIFTTNSILLTLFVSLLITIVYINDLGRGPLRFLRNLSSTCSYILQHKNRVLPVRNQHFASQRSCLETRESGRRYRWFIGVIMVSFFWVQSAEKLPPSPAYLTVIWTCRILSLAFLAFTRDSCASFSDLEGACGFGLLVDKHDLCISIQAHLSGRGWAKLNIRRYKGSLLRMQETVAVSYRWQSRKVQLSPDSFVNMSEWQLSTLLEALQKCNCLYVWIDHMSVPQGDEDPDMQDQLLTRMMAVYSSAGLTIVLRSLELPFSRYHERGWTLQEYCSARTLVILTQDSLPSDNDDRDYICAVKAEEEELYQQIREIHLKSIVSNRPVWIFGTQLEQMNAEEMMEKLALCVKLEGMLQTQEPMDLIRALYPIIWGRPVENHVELTSLVSDVFCRLNTLEAIDNPENNHILQDLDLLKQESGNVLRRKRTLAIESITTKDSHGEATYMP